jgi:hypothetical protein
MISSQSVSTKVLRIGYGFFMLMIISAYTANLASTLISSPVTLYQLKDIDDAVARKLSICAFNQAAITTLTTYYPGVTVVKIDTTDAAVCLQAVIAGKDCSALQQ